jgi:hypothetical protein
MIYVLDTSAFIVMGHYFPSRFPGFWRKFDQLVGDRRIVSVKEVYRELDNEAAREHLRAWVKTNKAIFLAPTPQETAFISSIFQISRFQALLNKKALLRGRPVADPFVIASARVNGGCVVTEEARKEGAARIPNVCDHFHVECINLEAMMAREGWTF